MSPRLTSWCPIGPSRDDLGRRVTPRVNFTSDDFLSFPDDGRRHELIDGDHQVTPSPNTKHQTVSLNLTLALATYLRNWPLGRLFVAPFDVVLSDLDVVEPDLVYIAKEHDARVANKNVRGTPRLGHGNLVARDTPHRRGVLEPRKQLVARAPASR